MQAGGAELDSESALPVRCRRPPCTALGVILPGRLGQGRPDSEGVNRLFRVPDYCAWPRTCIIGVLPSWRRENGAATS